MTAEDQEPPAAARRAADRLLADAARAAAASRARAGAAAVDLFLPDQARLSDAERATAAHLLEALVAAVEEDLRGRLAPLLPDQAILARAAPLAAPLLARAGLLRDAALVDRLLRRATEHRLVRALAAAAARDAATESPPADISDATGDPRVAAAAAALHAAERRRLDRFAAPALAPADLPGALLGRLAWRVAAGLRAALDVEADPARIEGALADAVAALRAGHDEADRLEGRALALAEALDAAGRLDDAVLARALAEGRIALLVAGIAARAGLRYDAAWELVADPEGSRLVVLLRAIGVARAAAADIALRLALAFDWSDDGERVADRIDAYEALAPERARAAIAPWRRDPDFAEALAALEAGLARREGT